ncbi:hypothetical protein [Natronococcus roseus]|uniref:hypothetical protein n=1 Tax=Natronococcus roseus TaxID=1052014 RepID=UPI00374D0152
MIESVRAHDDVAETAVERLGAGNLVVGRSETRVTNLEPPVSGRNRPEPSRADDRAGVRLYRRDRPELTGTLYDTSPSAADLLEALEAIGTQRALHTLRFAESTDSAATIRDVSLVSRRFIRFGGAEPSISTVTNPCKLFYHFQSFVLTR